MKQMKRSAIKLCCLLLLITTAISIPVTAAVQTKESKIVEKTTNGIHFSVDPRLELLSAIQILSSYDETHGILTQTRTQYRTDVLAYFKPYSAHEAVKLFNEMSIQGFSFDAPPAFMMYLTENYELREDIAVTDYLIQRAGEIEKLETFAKAVKQFAKDSKFDQFYAKNSSYYNTLIENESKKLKEDYISGLETFYGKKQNGYHIVLVPLFHSGGFASTMTYENGTSDIYSFNGPAQETPDHMISFGSEQGFQYLVQHEFGHAFVNPLFDKYSDRLDTVSALFQPIIEDMTRMAYGSWETCVNEHILRAIEARMAFAIGGQTAYDEVIRDEKEKNHFIYVEALAEKIAEYEKNRAKYKTFEEFYPELITVFEKLNQK